MFLDINQIFQLRKARVKAKIPFDISDSLVSENFKTIQIGNTFIPEGLDESEVLDVLRYIVVELGVKDLRLGIRQTSVDLDNNSLGVYGKILQFCFENTVRLTLNIGPIKCCGWPEYHLCEKVLNDCPDLPSNGKVLTSKDLLTSNSLQYLEKLLQIINQKYTKKELEHIVCLQPENEAFNPFGVYRWTFDKSHLDAVLGLMDRYLPNRKVLFNSAGMFDVDKIIRYLSKRNDTNRFILGIDYYYTIDGWENSFLIRWIDILVFSWKWGNIGLQKLKKNKEKYGFEIEITEAQMEPWGKAVDPGNKLESLLYVLLRTKNILYKQQGVIRLWGLDKLAKKAIKKELTLDQTKMLDLIKEIQRQW